MQVFPINGDTVIAIDEGETVQFIPIVSDPPPKQITEELIPEREPCCVIEYNAFCFVIKSIGCGLISCCIFGLIIYLIACDHGMCGSKTVFGQTRYSPPPK